MNVASAVLSLALFEKLTATAAPSPANFSAIAAPIPFGAPVMIATLPDKFAIAFSSPLAC
jgi:hypothetical protein